LSSAAPPTPSTGLDSVFLLALSKSSQLLESRLFP
jgi:hypothetical protein